MSKSNAAYGEIKPSKRRNSSSGRQLKIRNSVSNTVTVSMNNPAYLWGHMQRYEVALIIVGGLLAVAVDVATIRHGRKKERFHYDLAGYARESA